MHSSLQISGPQSQLRSRVLIGGSVSQSHSDHGAQSPGSHFSKDLFSYIILLIEKVTKWYLPHGPLLQGSSSTESPSHPGRGKSVSGSSKSGPQ